MADLVFSIDAINTLNYSLDIPNDFIFLDSKHELYSNREYTVSINLKASKVSILIDFELEWRKNNLDDNKSKLFGIQVETIFKIQNLQTHLGPDQRQLEQKLLRFLLSLAISHLRGIQSLYTNKTELGNAFISHELVNPTDMEVIRNENS